MNDDDNTYECACCGGVFIKDRSDEEAMAEAKGEFGDKLGDNPPVVCDDCYNAMRKNYRVLNA